MGTEFGLMLAEQGVTVKGVGAMAIQAAHLASTVLGVIGHVIHHIAYRSSTRHLPQRQSVLAASCTT